MLALNIRTKIVSVADNFFNFQILRLVITVLELLMKRMLPSISSNIKIIMMRSYIWKIINVRHVILLSQQEVSIVVFAITVLVDLIITVFGLGNVLDRRIINTSLNLLECMLYLLIMGLG